jgi:hypothetical protein
MPSNLAILKRTMWARRLAHELLLARALSVFGDDFAGHRRVLLIGDRMHGEKLYLLVIEPVVLAERIDMFLRVTAESTNAWLAISNSLGAYLFSFITSSTQV